MSLIRQAITDLNDMTRLTEVAIVDDMVNYHNRQTDKATVRAAIKTRYGIGIKKSSDPTNGEPLETYSREGFSEQVDAGMIEAISGGFGPRIYNALSTLFTERGQKYTLIHKDTTDNNAIDTQSAEDLLQAHRKAGGYNATLTSSDKLSIQVGSAAVFLDFARDHIQYQKYSPADIAVYYSDTIEEDGEKRLVDQTDLEDATAIRIRLSQVDTTTWNYLAIYGRSEIYPQGRKVQYQADSTGGEVPKPGEDGSIDWYPEGSNEVGNPLSVYANENDDIPDLPEYPIAIIQSGITDSGDVMPISTSLYTDCTEIDTAASHLLATSQTAASGTLAIKRDGKGRNHPLPKTAHGVVAFDDGQIPERIDSDSQASIDGIKVMDKLSVNIAAGYSVPDYMAMSDFSETEVPSGEQLKVKTRPLIMFRNDRVELNQPPVGKIFRIEKALLELFVEGSDSEITLLKECTQTWDAGDLILPENKKEKTERNIALRDAGGIDEIEFIRRENDLNSDEEAIDLYTKYAERAADYPPLKAEPEAKQPLALPGRTRTPTV